MYLSLRTPPDTIIIIIIMLIYTVKV